MRNKRAKRACLLIVVIGLLWRKLVSELKKFYDRYHDLFYPRNAAVSKLLSDVMRTVIH